MSRREKDIGRKYFSGSKKKMLANAWEAENEKQRVALTEFPTASTSHKPTLIKDRK